MSNCYVPNCDITAEEAGEKNRLIFKAPSTGVYKWMKYLPRRDTPFNPRSEGVCVKHFEDKYIEKEEVISICGERQVFSLDPWILTSDAIPTIFPKTDNSETTNTDNIRDTVNANPVSVESNVSATDFEPNDEAQTFDDLIRFDSLNGTNDNNVAEDEGAGFKRKSPPPSKPGPSSKKLKGSEPESILPDDGEPFGRQTPPGGRPAHLKREIVPPSRLRESMASGSADEVDEDYEDVGSPPDSPPSPANRRKGGRGGRRGRPRGAASAARGRKRGGTATPSRTVPPLKVKLPTGYAAVKITPGLAGQRGENACFIEYCDHNPSATLFKMPQMTKAKLKDWMRYIPAAAISKTPFDPRVHFLCEDHFDKKFIMSSAKGKILTGDAIPSIFPNYPKQSYTMGAMPVKGRAAATPPSKGKKPVGPKGRVEVVDGYEIEYDSDPDYSPITVTIDDDDEISTDTKKPPPIKKPGTSSVPIAKPKPVGKILEITDAGYNLQYIYETRERIQLPQAEFWMFRMIVDKESKTKCIFIAEIVSRLERLMVRRSIRIRQDLTFKVEANGSDFTQMFNETGNKVDSLYKLQEMILDLSAFKVCEGWAQFEALEPNSLGKKIEGIWFAKNCEGLNLNNNRCRPCIALKQALTARKSSMSLNSANPAMVQQIRQLPKDDPLHLQLQIQDHLREKTKLKYELSVVEKRESRLQDKIKMLEAGMKVKGKTVYVTTATSVPSSSQPAAPNSTVVSPGKLSHAPTYNLVTPSRAIVRPRAFNPSNTTTTFTLTRPTRIQTPIIVTPTPVYPVAVDSSTTNPRHPLQQQTQASTNIITSVGPLYQPSILTPTFVLAQGSDGQIGHQTIETTQVLPAISLGSATLPGVNVTLQKAGESGPGSEEITLLSL